MGVTKDEVGNRYVRLLVVGRAGSQGGKAAWACLCDCGTTIAVTGDILRQGHQKSCGCYRKEATRLRQSYHGHSNSGGLKRESRTYKSWQEMWRRCTVPSHISYKNYGGKGILVTEEWADFKVFLSDMGERPPNTSIDRKDGDLGYCKGNCKWSSRVEQSQNRSQCHRITLNGVTHVLAEWCRRLSVDYNKAYRAIVTKGMNPEDVFHAALASETLSTCK